MKYILIVITLLSTGCARMWINYPPRVLPGGVGSDGKFVQGKVVAARAIEFNGADSLGATQIDVTNGGVHYASAGGIDTSTSTKAGYRTVRHAVSAAASVATTKILADAATSAYNTQQAANVSTARITAKGAALPAAGSTVPAQVPATVVPIVP